MFGGGDGDGDSDNDKKTERFQQNGAGGEGPVLRACSDKASDCAWLSLGVLSLMLAGDRSDDWLGTNDSL